MCVQHLCEYAISQKGEDDLASVLAIFLTCTMQTCHKKFGFGIQHFRILSKSYQKELQHLRMFGVCYILLFN